MSFERISLKEAEPRGASIDHGPMSYFDFNPAPRPPRSSLLRRIGYAILILLLLPYLLTPLYLFVTPVSTPMLWR